jgi:hypothetical protein
VHRDADGHDPAAPSMRSLRTGAEDDVLRLTESVAADWVAQTLREYVVTPDLQAAFDRALIPISQSISSGESRAAFLSGSFGPGKSHFMAHRWWFVIRPHPWYA